MRIHPVFHVSLLEKAESETAVNKETQIDDKALEPYYQVETVLDHAVQGRQHSYLVKWEGYPSEENTWVPYRNFEKCRHLVLEFHREHPTHSSPSGLKHLLHRGN
jgi:hypothetical protein